MINAHYGRSGDGRHAFSEIRWKEFSRWSHLVWSHKRSEDWNGPVAGSKTRVNWFGLSFWRELDVFSKGYLRMWSSDRVRERESSWKPKLVGHNDDQRQTFLFRAGEWAYRTHYTLHNAHTTIIRIFIVHRSLCHFPIRQSYQFNVVVAKKACNWTFERGRRRRKKAREKNRNGDIGTLFNEHTS